MTRGATWPTAPTRSGWTRASFADGAWPTGSAELGYGDGDEATVIPRTGLSALFRRTFEADPAAAPYLELRLNADDGATVWINGRPVVAENMPSGMITADTPASSPVSGAQESDFTTYRAAVERPGQPGTNSIAVSVHQSDSSSVDLTFDLSLTRTTTDGTTTPTPDISLPSAPPPPPGGADRAGADRRDLAVPGRRLEPGHRLAQPRLRRRRAGPRARPASASRSAARPR